MEYKVGDWVVVVDTPGIRRWNRGVQAINYCFQLNAENIDRIKRDEVFNCPTNQFCINYTLEDIRRALPKEIPGYIPSKPENYKQLKRILKQLKIK